MASELAVHGEQWLLANKLSLNSLQDRLACASQLSLKRVIASNLVVNSGAKLGKFRLMPRFWHEIAFSSSSLVRLLDSDLGLLLLVALRGRYVVA
jgi:hypothetical protein